MSAAASPIVNWRDAGRPVNGADGSPDLAVTNERRCGMHTLPWHVPVPHSAARLISSMCRNPLSHTICRSSTVTFEHGQTMPAVGHGGSSN